MGTLIRAEIRDMSNHHGAFYTADNPVEAAYRAMQMCNLDDYDIVFGIAVCAILNYEMDPEASAELRAFIEKHGHPRSMASLSAKLQRDNEELDERAKEYES